MFPAQIPQIIPLSHRLMAGGQNACNADAKASMIPPREDDHDRSKEVPFSDEQKQMDTSIETMSNQASTKDKLLNEELLANDSLGG